MRGQVRPEAHILLLLPGLACMRHAPLHRCVVYTVIYQGIGRNTAPYETTYTYNPSDARAARALCGDDGRAERVPRDKDPLELKTIRAVGYSYCLMRCGYMHMYGFRNIITTHTPLITRAFANRYTSLT